MNSELIYQIGITKIPNVGAVTARQLISYCGGVEAVFKTPKSHLLKIPNIGPITAESIAKQEVLLDAEAEMAFLEKYKIQPIFYLDKNYPGRLKYFNDAPVMLFYKGTSNLNHERIVGIVGTRKPTDRGKAICEEIVESLKPYNPLIISGLAYGIDITAHRKSVDMGIETIGVLGHGLRQIYPSAHKSTAERMVENGGILTEFTSQVTPVADNFPARNRIIAALCDALIVVETARSGGSIITANFANDYNKDVFAIPGRVKDTYSEGCNALIKTNKAFLMESVEDLIYIMRWDEQKQEIAQRAFFVELEPDEQKIIELLQTQESMDVDTLSHRTQFSQSQLAALLLNLEFRGVIRALPGKRYMII